VTPVAGRWNWAGSHEYRAPALLDARSLEEAQRVVAAGGRVRALGTRHSFSDVPDTTGTLVSLVDVAPEFALDETARTVSVTAGTRYGALAVWLEERGWALHNLGSLPHISIGGAVATGTHGSGDGNGILATAVRAIEYIAADGSLVRAQVGDPGFEGLVPGIGAYGIVARLTLAVEPSYRIRQDAYEGLTWTALLADLPAITGAGYSVNVFTRWDDDVVGRVWMKTRLSSDEQEPPARLLDAEREDAPLAVAANRTRIGAPGAWLETLPHFRFDAEPSNGDEIQSEYFVAPTDAAVALRAVRAVADRLGAALTISELRTAAPDDLWLSGAYERGAFGIHFTWVNDLALVTPAVRIVESVLADFAARPHWGKFHLFDAGRAERAVPRLAEARAQFELLDPQGVFWNEHLARVGLREAR
jgi:alditol oxidase